MEQRKTWVQVLAVPFTLNKSLPTLSLGFLLQIEIIIVLTSQGGY